MLRYYIKKALGPWNLFKPDVIVSVPAGVTSTERRAVVEAALKSGAKNAYVIKEPILAAIGAGIPIHEPRGHMIADAGGGTIDVAVISLGGIVASTSVKCAGNRIDQAIADYIKKTYNLAIGDKTAEDIKIGIGSAVPVEEELIMTIKGRDLLSGLPRTTTISTNEIVRAISRELREMIKAERPPRDAAGAGCGHHRQGYHHDRWYVTVAAFPGTGLPPHGRARRHGGRGGVLRRQRNRHRA
jgi:rod shape-determining protein MreB